MCSSNGVRLADYRNDGRLALELAKHIEVQVLVEAPKDGASHLDHIRLLACLGNVPVQADRIEQEEDTVDVCVLDTWRTYNFLLLAKGILELGLEEGGDDGQLEINDALLEAFGVPQCNADALAIDFGFEVLGGKRRVLGNGGRRRRRSIRPPLGGESEGSAQEVDEGRLAAAFGANDKDTV
jgi:hypothetical protein